MSKEIPHDKLVEMVTGKPQPPRVVFFDQPRLDHAASKEAGRRVYTNSVMVKRSNPGVRDWVAEFAQKADFLAHPEEYERYLATRKGTTSPSISIIPNADPIHIQELIDYGLGTIGALCDAEVLPEHLQYVQDGAKVIRTALEAASNGNREESIQKEVKEEVQNIADHISSQIRKDVPAEGGQEHRHHERRPEPPRVRVPESESRAQGHAQGGRSHGDRREVGVNWNLTIEV